MPTANDNGGSDSDSSLDYENTRDGLRPLPEGGLRADADVGPVQYNHSFDESLFSNSSHGGAGASGGADASDEEYDALENQARPGNRNGDGGGMLDTATEGEQYEEPSSGQLEAYYRSKGNSTECKWQSASGKACTKQRSAAKGAQYCEKHTCNAPACSKGKSSADTHCADHGGAASRPLSLVSTSTTTAGSASSGDGRQDRRATTRLGPIKGRSGVPQKKPKWTSASASNNIRSRASSDASFLGSGKGKGKDGGMAKAKDKGKGKEAGDGSRASGRFHDRSAFQDLSDNDDNTDDHDYMNQPIAALQSAGVAAAMGGGGGGGGGGDKQLGKGDAALHEYINSAGAVADAQTDADLNSGEFNGFRERAATAGESIRPEHSTHARAYMHSPSQVGSFSRALCSEHRSAAVVCRCRRTCCGVLTPLPRTDDGDVLADITGEVLSSPNRYAEGSEVVSVSSARSFWDKIGSESKSGEKKGSVYKGFEIDEEEEC